MTKLPVGWLSASLVDLGCEHRAGVWGADPSAEPSLTMVRIVRNGDISPSGVIRWEDLPERSLTEREIDKALLQLGDVLVTTSGEVGKTALWTGLPSTAGDALFGASNFVRRIRGPSPALSTWIYYFLRTTEAQGLFRDYARGVAIQNLFGELWRVLCFPIAPPREQHRIVSAIESYLTRLDDAVATLERVERNLKRYRASVLKAAVEGRLVPTEAELARAEGREYEPASVLLERILAERRRRWEEADLAKMKAKGKVPKDNKWKAKYVEPVAPDTSNLPELPEGWCWAGFSQLGELGRGKSKHRPRNDPRLLGGPYPFIQTGDVRRADGFITEYSSTYSEFGLTQSRLWPAGTLCITIAANIAETGILTFASCFPDSVVGFLAHPGSVDARFLELFLRTAKQDLVRYAPATAQRNINLDILAGLAVPLPPLAEQERIIGEVARLLSVGTYAEGSSMQTTIRAGRLRQSILKWAFEGRLVDQDPNDEPASVLLERIRAERAAVATKPQRRTRQTRKAAPKK